MVEVMSKQAMKVSAERSTRDRCALVWTVKSLADNIELEPLIEAILDVLWGPEGWKNTYEDHIQSLLRNSDLELQSHIEGLLRSCDSGLLSPDTIERRRITCFKALWAIASLISPLPNAPEPLDLWTIHHYSLSNTYDTDVVHYSTSLMKFSTLCTLRTWHTVVSEYLAQCAIDARRGHTPNLKPVTSFMLVLLNGPFFFEVDQVLWHYIYGAETSIPISDLIPRLADAIQGFWGTTPYRIFFDFLYSSASLESPLYRWFDTCTTIALDHTTPFSGFKNDLIETLETVVYGQSHRMNAEDVHWLDVVVHELCFSWRPEQPIPIPHALIQYLNNRKSDYTLVLLLSTSFGEQLWAAFAITLLEGPSVQPPPADSSTVFEQVLASLWRVASIDYDPRWTAAHDLIFDAVKKQGTSPMSFSVHAMINLKLLHSLPHKSVL
ncbi:hypothetical protein DFH07DRAFT_948371 [Mycena maculata]|uniref:Uncharacterized protein n=1 Tax=Mycena maculata TaxID=230809 RepID=A0AAD7P256_9AGAR|nr:hypothetical protein DFH07DRAFT_948371 [Mycena maculata]